MRYPALLSATVLLASSCVAMAQEAPYSHTLNEQLSRVQQGQPATPYGVGQAGTAYPQAQNVQTTQSYDRNAPINSQGGGAIPALPLNVQTSNGIRYLTGGIGDEELAELKSMEREFNVQLLMSADSGDYVSEVSLRVLNGQGEEILNAPSTGPYVYISLKPGAYTFELTSKQGESKKVKVTAPAKGAAKPQVRFNI